MSLQFNPESIVPEQFWMGMCTISGRIKVIKMLWEGTVFHMENRTGNFHSTGIKQLFIPEKNPQITELRRKKKIAFSLFISYLVIAIFHYSISINNYQSLIIFSCYQCARSRNVFFYFFYILPQYKGTATKHPGGACYLKQKLRKHPR